MLTQEEKDRTLKNFMEEHFDFNELVKVGLFKKKWKGDYEAQAKRVCEFFGYDSVYEYGSKTFTAHLSFAGERPKGYENFITTFKAWHES